MKGENKINLGKRK